jgi:long-subunit acyl-CoA synthetase (AMP-forming)
MTIRDALSAALPRWSQRQAIAECDLGASPRICSFGQLWDEVEAISRQFAAWGIGNRHRVPLFLENSIEYIESFLALLAIRAVPVIVQQDFRMLELDEVFSNAQPQAVIAEERHLNILRQYLENKLVIGRRNRRFYLIQNDSGGSVGEELPEETASIHYTYRGYGYPLGSLAPHTQYLTGARCFQKCVQFHEGGSLLPILPFSHLFSLVGCVVLSLLFGIRIIITPSFSPRNIFNLIHEMGVDYLISVPDILLMLSRLVDTETSFPSLQVLVSGGSFLGLEDQLDIERAFGVELLNGYGLTEFTPITGNIRGQSKKGTIGLPCESLQVKIDNGEICLRTEDMAKSYLRRPNETREAMRDGWFRTGDLGRYEGSHLVFTREKKETRKVHGSMVDLNEVRRAIELVDPALEVAVETVNGSLIAGIGVPASADLAEKTAEIRSALKQLIAGYKIPRKFCRLDEFPHGGSKTCQ